MFNEIPDDDEYVDEADDKAIFYDANGNFDEAFDGRPKHFSVPFYVVLIAAIVCLIFVTAAFLLIILILKKSRKKLLYVTGRSVMTFSNPNYYTSNPGETPPAAATNVDKKPFLWKRLKYDKSQVCLKLNLKLFVTHFELFQERVYEDKGSCSSPEVTSLIPTVLTPSSSHCEAITPEMERSPSITPLRRNSLNPVV